MLKKIFHRYINTYRGLPSKAWLLAFAVLINRSGSMVLTFMTLYLVSVQKFSAVEAGFVITLYGAGSILGSISGGFLTDRIGDKSVQVISLFFNGMGFIILAFVSTPFWIKSLMFLTGMLSESFRPANSTAVARICSEEIRAQGYALNRLAINLGMAIGPAMGGMLIAFGYQFLFFADGATCFISALFMLVFYKEANTDFSNVKTEKPSLVSSGPLKDLPFLFFVLMLMIFGMIMMQLFTTQPLFLKEVYKLTPFQIGLLFTCNATVIVFTEMPLTSKLQKLNVIKVVSLGILLFAGGMALLPFYTGFSYALVTVMIWTAGEMMTFPFFPVIVSKRAPSNRTGSYMGFYNLSFSSSVAAGPALGALVYQNFGAHALWLSIGVVGILLSFFIRSSDIVKG